MLSGCGRPRPHYNETLLLPDNEILTINYSLFTFLSLFGYYLVIIWLLFGYYLVIQLPIGYLCLTRKHLLCYLYNYSEILTIDYSLFTFLPLFGDYLVIIW